MKRLARIKAANLRSHFLREFKKQCPTCLAPSRKRRALLEVAADIKEKQELSKEKWLMWIRVEYSQSGQVEGTTL